MIKRSKEIGISLLGIGRFSEASSLDAFLSALHEELVLEFSPARALLFVRDENYKFTSDPYEWFCEPHSAASAHAFLKLLRALDEQSAEFDLENEFIEPVWNIGHKDLIVSRLKIPEIGTVTVLVFDPQFGSTAQLDFFLSTAFSIYSNATTPAILEPSRNEGDSERYVRLVEHSDAILLHTDANHVVQFISRRALDFFGMAPEEFLSGNLIRWIDLILPEDSNRLKEVLHKQGNRPETVDEEVRIINRITGRARWVLVRLVPVLSKGGELVGWDGFGIDISQRRDAQEALDQQSKKIRALYTVSSAIRGYLEPSNISIRGLAALCEATGANAGICFLYSPKNELAGESWDIVPKPDRELQQIARYGFKSTGGDRESILTSISSFAAYVAQSGQSLVVPDLCSDPRADVALATQDELHSAIFVPIAVEEEVLGAVGLFSSTIGNFDGGTVMLVGAAANQIGLAARQANLFNLYQRQTKNLSALYRMSHELSQNLELDSLFQNAFAIIRDELGLKRLWLGLLDESGTRLEGKAVYGPGWRRRLIDVVVNVTSSDHALGRVVKTRKPVVIERAEDLLHEFGVKRLFSQMSIHAVAVVPIIASGEIIGILAVQPGVNEPEFKPEQLNLLVSLASEIGVNIQTIRLAERTKEGEKMRTSSVLAAGIAHNFNNSLQAILGQASLLEMQISNPERVEKAAKAITEAANKSAVLVRQLLSFTQLEEPKREILNIGEFLTGHQEVFAKILTPTNLLEIQVPAELRSVYIDASQLTRVFSALLQNSLEAMPNGGKVSMVADSVEVVDERSVSEVPPGKYVRIRIRDNGVGMSEEVKQRCFEPFFTTKNIEAASGLSLTGAGLGLAAAYTLIKRNSGRILIDSQLGNGTTVTLYLPEATQAQLERNDQVSFERQIKIERIRVGGNKNEKEKNVPTPNKPAEHPEEPATAKKPDIGVPQGNA